MTDKQTSTSSEETGRNAVEHTFEYRDEFKRKPIGENIIKLLNANLEVFPMLIDGDWGTGKTEFCWKLIKLMKKENTYQPMHINAFQAEHADEPLLTILAEIVKNIPEENEKARSEFMEKALPLLRFSLKTIGKVAFSDAITQDKNEVKGKLDSVLQEETNKGIDALVESALKSHVDGDKNLKILQTALEDMAKKKPLVLFIDELDRCKSDFVIHMLEVLKYVFNVKGIYFILVCNEEQLKTSISHGYGGTLDAQRYLDKFLKFTFSLPKRWPGINEQTHASIQYYEDLIKKSSILKSVISTEGTDSMFNFVKHVIKMQNMSLSEIEIFVRHTEVCQIITNNKAFEKGKLTRNMFNLIGILLFCFNPKLADAMFKNQLDAKDLGLFFGEKSIKPYTAKIYLPHQILLVMLAKECHQNTGLVIPTDGELKKMIEGYDPQKEMVSQSFSKRPYSDIVMNAFKALNLSNPLER